jgi:hypothetical protein
MSAGVVLEILLMDYSLETQELYSKLNWRNEAGGFT